jgi:membrane protein required for colicin V production
VNLGELLESVNMVDIVIVLVVCAGFVLGFAQGAIRRLVGIASMVFSFLVAAQLSQPLGQFLASNWTQWPSAYSHMLGFLTLFVAAVIAFSLVIQGTYHRTAVLARYPVIDELLGGLLGALQVMVLLTFLVIILDQAFLVQGLNLVGGEVPWLREVWTTIGGSGTGALLHDTVIPGFLGIVTFLVPQSILATYGLV